MIKWIKSFRFWLTLLSLTVIYMCITKIDEIGFTLVLTSPILWLSVFFPSLTRFPISITYVITVVFWFLIGYFLDQWMHHIKSSSHET